MILLLDPVSLLPPPSPLNQKLNPSSIRPRLRLRCRCRPEWGTNAESVRPRRFGPKGSRPNQGVEEEVEEKERRKWWSDYSNDGYDSLDDDYDDFDMFDDSLDERVWDKFWILKVADTNWLPISGAASFLFSWTLARVFKSLGYFSPVIIGSMLLATGPQALLMALALPLGQSAISILLDNVWGKKERKKPRRRTKRRGPFVRPDGEMFNRKEESREEINNNNNNNKRGYRSWASTGNGDASGGMRRSGLGGWDELDETYGRGETVRKLSKRRRYQEVPLFKRLLVAVFPFLGSWFRIL